MGSLPVLKPAEVHQRIESLGFAAVRHVSEHSPNVVKIGSDIPKWIGHQLSGPVFSMQIQHAIWKVGGQPAPLFTFPFDHFVPRSQSIPE